ncbi:MAG: hypothetical protein EOO73_12450 [Myxococcales bacterium]|nr:MAG: hypothetical protein EOO73_12450 [Myxococcales bacterium]
MKEATSDMINTRKLTGLSAVLLCGALQAGCSEDADRGGRQAAEGPLFAVPTQVYGADFATSTSYVAFVPSLDVERIQLDDARELNERGTVAKLGDYFFMASSSKPVVDRFELQADGSLAPAGSLNFSNYGLPEYFTLDAWGGVLVDAERAYVFNAADGSHVAWNPTTLEITGTIEGPGVVKEGYNLESIAVVRGDRMYRVFTLLNYETWEFLPSPQYLAVYDLKTDELIDLVEDSRCPQLYSRPFVDEQGDIYFSGWVWTPGLTLTGDYPASCSLRIKAGEDTFDPDWQLDFAADITEGREAAVMRPLGDGKVLLDVFHDERVTIDEATDPQELSNTPNWRLWMVDLKTKQGAPIDSLGFKAGGYSDVQVDGRNFLMVPNEDYSETTAYELADGEARAGFAIQGSVDQILKLR